MGLSEVLLAKNATVKSIKQHQKGGTRIKFVAHKKQIPQGRKEDRNKEWEVCWSKVQNVEVRWSKAKKDYNYCQVEVITPETPFEFLQNRLGCKPFNPEVCVLPNVCMFVSKRVAFREFFFDSRVVIQTSSDEEIERFLTGLLGEKYSSDEKPLNREDRDLVVQSFGYQSPKGRQEILTKYSLA